MSEVKELIFPDLVYFEDYSGNFQNYFNAVYKIFEKDFIKQSLNYEGQIVIVRKYPLVDGIHKTFYHITHQGEDENNRTPDFRRMERMRFPKFVIDNNKHQDILIWKNTRGRDERIVLFNETENYIVVLTERSDSYLFITAYFIETEHRKRKLLQEYETYKKAKTA
jgi:hypothetical protein